LRSLLREPNRSETLLLKSLLSHSKLSFLASALFGKQSDVMLKTSSFKVLVTLSSKQLMIERKKMSSTVDTLDFRAC
jgi:hypothetical protein